MSQIYLQILVGAMPAKCFLSQDIPYSFSTAFSEANRSFSVAFSTASISFALQSRVRARDAVSLFGKMNVSVDVTRGPVAEHHKW
jgi:hypothetical protein